MVQWTSPFMIGITYGSSNSDDVLFQPLPGFYIIIPQSTFGTGKRPRFPTTSFGDLRAANYTIPAFLFPLSLPVVLPTFTLSVSYDFTISMS
jgi:hypothetical protein